MKETKISAKELFNTINQLTELNHEELISIIWSNHIKEDFMQTMTILIQMIAEKKFDEKNG